VQELSAAVMCGSKRQLTVRRLLPVFRSSPNREYVNARRRSFSFTREARGWSIVNLSILVSYKCKALMNVCAMARPVSL
jgi:hypothetical protein